MASILHLCKRLEYPPSMVEAAGIGVRSFAVPGDVAAWLALRERSLAWLSPQPRTWTREDFQREMLDKDWWRAERTWLAVTDGSASDSIVGAVTMAVRNGGDREMPVAHWLLVDPAWRRRGVGRALMSRLELAAWEAGWREVQLETHSGWTAAVAFYQSMGYEAVRDASPR